MADFSVEPIFATPIIVARLDDTQALNEALSGAILERRTSDPGIAQSNLGGWHSQLDFFSWAGEPGAVVARAAIELADAHTTDQAAIPGKRRGWRLEAWANVIDCTGAHVEHFHPGAFWSAVYYVRVDPGEGGQLMLYDPRGAMTQMHAPDLLLVGGGGERQVAFTPEAGQLVMFPSWLTHSVTPYAGDGRRISVAINLTAGPRPVV